MKLTRSFAGVRNNPVVLVLVLSLFMAVSVVVLPEAALGVTVSAGSPSSFQVEGPSSVQAGENFTLTLTVLDQQGNRVRDYSTYDREILLNATGDGELSRSTLNSTRFESGRTTVQLSYTKSETASIMVNERNNVASGRSNVIQVEAGRLDKFSVNAPSQARAGNKFSLRIKAFDQYGNLIRNYAGQSNGVSLQTTGEEAPKPESLPARQFDNGQLRTLVTYTAAEVTRFVVYDATNEIRSSSDTVTVKPGRLSDFTVSVPESAEAGKPFEMTIKARDQYGNIVDNYDVIGQGVDLSVVDGDRPSPAYVPPEDFEDGVATVRVTHNQAGSTKLQVQDGQSGVQARSNEIQIDAGELDRFTLQTPDQAKAGKEFNVTVKALDKFNNVIRDFSTEGIPVKLGIKGSKDSRKTIQPSTFDAGEATVSYRLRATGRNQMKAFSQQNESVSGLSSEVSVSPGPPGQLSIDVPETARAGNNFTVILGLRDQFGNLIRQPGFLEGTVEVSLTDHPEKTSKTVKPGEFINGRKRVVFRHTVAEPVSVSARYENYEISNESQSIEIHPGPFDRIDVNSPEAVQAGSDFELTFTLLDRYGNELQSIPNRFSSFKLLSSGSGNIEPRIVPRTQMAAPSFSVPLKYFVAEDISIEVFDSQFSKLGGSSQIQITPGPLEGFTLQTPAEIFAAEEFTLRIEAYDSFHNTVTNLDQREGSIELNTNSQTSLSQRWLQFNDFEDGVAEVSLTYNRAGKLRIAAESRGVKTESRPIRVKPGKPASYDVVTQGKIKAGEPFPVAIRVYDQFENPVTNLPDDFHGVKLTNEGDLTVHPTKIAPSLFSEGEANVHLAVTGTGNLSLSVSPLENPLKTPQVDRFFITREVDTTTITVLSSHDLSKRMNLLNNPTSKNIKISLEPAKLLVDRRKLNFQGWFVNSIKQSQMESESFPVVSLNVYPNEPINLDREQKDNLSQFVLSRATATTSTTLEEIQRLIQDEKFTEADKRLGQYLQEHPDDQDALQLRLRLQRLEDVAGSQ